jgi:hypothetical protein
MDIFTTQSGQSNQLGQLSKPWIVIINIVKGCVWKHANKTFGRYVLCYLCNFNINYVIFKNVETFNFIYL